MSALRIGISTCPNDTFAFDALLTGAEEVEGESLAFELLDVEQLNERMLAGHFDVAKVSYHAALAMAERIVVLPSGSALGFGVGPLVLGAKGRRDPADTAAHPAPPIVLSPGRWTTAHLLWKLFHDEPAHVDHVVFSEIMPRLARGHADYGVCIHEGRFTYADSGLEFVEDLGTRWEDETGAPLPLGGIVCRRDLGPERIAHVQRALARSIDHAREVPERALPTMRAHAQELSDEVLWKHVELYVNDATRDLGEAGRKALARLAALARGRGLLPGGATLEVFA